MKNYKPLYYLLFILLIMGTFASMAQNSYGLTIIGSVAFIFGLIFLFRILFLLQKKERDRSAYVEPVCLLVISVILGFRVFYIYFSNIEWIFVAATVILIVFYIRKMMTRFHYYRDKNRFLATMVIIYHCCILLFLSSFILILFAPSIAQFAGAAAMVFLLAFIVGAWLKKEVLVDGNNVSAFTMVSGFKGYSIILVTLILLFSLYFGLNRAGVLPAIYSDEYPHAYFDLVNEAATGNEKTINGEYKYQQFLKKYNQFLEHNTGNIQ